MRRRPERRLTTAELAVVVVFVAAALSIPAHQLVQARSAGSDAAALGVAGGLTANAAINAGARMARQAGARSLDAANVCTADALRPYLDAPAVSLTTAPAAAKDQFQIGGQGDCSPRAGNVSVACSVTPASGQAVRAVVICAR